MGWNVCPASHPLCPSLAPATAAATTASKWCHMASPPVCQQPRMELPQEQVSAHTGVTCMHEGLSAPRRNTWTVGGGELVSKGSSCPWSPRSILKHGLHTSLGGPGGMKPRWPGRDDPRRHQWPPCFTLPKSSLLFSRNTSPTEKILEAN